MFDRKTTKPLATPSVVTPSPDPSALARRRIVGGPAVTDSSSTSAPPRASVVEPSIPVSSSPARASSSESTTLGSNLVIEGNVKFSGTLVVNCSLRGSITGDDRLVIGAAADAEAEVYVGTAEIAGRVKGDVRATHTVRLLRGSQVIGDIETPTISMEEGVVFEGRCTRPEKPVQPTESVIASAPTVRPAVAVPSNPLAEQPV